MSEWTNAKMINCLTMRRRALCLILVVVISYEMYESMSHIKQVKLIGYLFNVITFEVIYECFNGKA